MAIEIVVGRGWTEHRVTGVGRVGLRARALGPRRTL
jgi:hypothetical protein